MSLLDLYTTRSEYRFAGIESASGVYAVYGFPFDSTASYRGGQRFAPMHVRRASANIESNGYYAEESYIEEVPLFDVGDVAVVHGDAAASLYRLEKVVESIAGDGGVPVGIGGEHLLTLGALRGLAGGKGPLCVIVLDAHFDLRDEYLGLRLSHATVFRRALEEGVASRIFYAGVRAWDRREKEGADRDSRVSYVSARRFAMLGPVNAAALARRHLEGCKRVYVSVDIDVLDPAFAPGVGNPEPGGIGVRDVLEFLAFTVDDRIAGFDVVEVSPPHDCGEAAAFAAAKILQELLLLANTARIRGPGRGRG